MSILPVIVVLVLVTVVASSAARHKDFYSSLRDALLLGSDGNPTSNGSTPRPQEIYSSTFPSDFPTFSPDAVKSRPAPRSSFGLFDTMSETARTSSAAQAANKGQFNLMDVNTWDSIPAAFFAPSVPATKTGSKKVAAAAPGSGNNPLTYSESGAEPSLAWDYSSVIVGSGAESGSGMNQDFHLPLADHSPGSTIADQTIMLSEWSAPPVSKDTVKYQEEPTPRPGIKRFSDGESMARAILTGQVKRWEWQYSTTLGAGMSSSGQGDRNDKSITCCQRLPYICGVDGMCVIDIEECKDFCTCAANPFMPHCQKIIPVIKRTMAALERKILAKVAKEMNMTTPSPMGTHITSQRGWMLNSRYRPLSSSLTARHSTPPATAIIEQTETQRTNEQPSSMFQGGRFPSEYVPNTPSPQFTRPPDLILDPGKQISMNNKPPSASAGVSTPSSHLTRLEAAPATPAPVSSLNPNWRATSGKASLTPVATRTGGIKATSPTTFTQPPKSTLNKPRKQTVPPSNTKIPDRTSVLPGNRSGNTLRSSQNSSPRSKNNDASTQFTSIRSNVNKTNDTTKTNTKISGVSDSATASEGGPLTDNDGVQTGGSGVRSPTASTRRRLRINANPTNSSAAHRNVTTKPDGSDKGQAEDMKGRTLSVSSTSYDSTKTTNTEHPRQDYGGASKTGQRTKEYSNGISTATKNSANISNTGSNLGPTSRTAGSSGESIRAHIGETGDTSKTNDGRGKDSIHANAGRNNVGSNRDASVDLTNKTNTNKHNNADGKNAAAVNGSIQHKYEKVSNADDSVTVSRSKDSKTTADSKNNADNNKNTTGRNSVLMEDGASNWNSSTDRRRNSTGNGTGNSKFARNREDVSTGTRFKDGAIPSTTTKDDDDKNGRSGSTRGMKISTKNMGPNSTRTSQNVTLTHSRNNSADTNSDLHNSDNRGSTDPLVTGPTPSFKPTQPALGTRKDVKDTTYLTPSPASQPTTTRGGLSVSAEDLLLLYGLNDTASDKVNHKTESTTTAEGIPQSHQTLISPDGPFPTPKFGPASSNNNTASNATSPTTEATNKQLNELSNSMISASSATNLLLNTTTSSDASATSNSPTLFTTSDPSPIVAKSATINNSHHHFSVTATSTLSSNILIQRPTEKSLMTSVGVNKINDQSITNSARLGKNETDILNISQRSKESGLGEERLDQRNSESGLDQRAVNQRINEFGLGESPSDQGSNESTSGHRTFDQISKEIGPGQRTFDQINNKTEASQSTFHQRSSKLVPAQRRNESKSGQRKNESGSGHRKNESGSTQRNNEFGSSQRNNESKSSRRNNESGSGQRNNEPGSDKRNNESGSGRINNESGSGKRNNESGSGRRNNESGSGQRNNESGSGRINNESGSGKRNNEPGSGQRNNESGSGRINNESGSGKRNNESGSGRRNNESGSGQRNNESGSGNRKNESGSGQRDNESGSSERNKEPKSGRRNNESGSGRINNEFGSDKRNNEPGSGQRNNEPGSGQRNNESGSSHRNNELGSGHRNNEHGSGHRNNEPGSGHRNNESGSGRINNESGSSHRNNEPGSGHRNNEPGSGHRNNESGSGRINNESGSSHRNNEPGSGHRNNEPGSGHRNNESGSGRINNESGSSHRNNEPGSGHRNNESGSGQRNNEPESGQRNNESGSGKRNNEPGSVQRNNESGSGRINNESGSGKRNNEPGSVQRNNESGSGQRNNESGSDQRNNEPGSDQRNNEPGSGQRNNEPGSGQRNNEPGSDQRNNEPGSGQRNNEPGSGQRNNEPGSGQINNEPGSAHRNNESGSGKINNKSGSGQRNNKSGSGNRNNESGFGQRKNESGSGHRNNESGSGQRNNKSGSTQRNNGSRSNQRNSESGSSQRNNKSRFSQRDSESRPSQRNSESGSSQRNNESSSSQIDKKYRSSQRDSESVFSQRDHEFRSSQRTNESRSSQRDHESSSSQRTNESRSSQRDNESGSSQRDSESGSGQRNDESESIQRDNESRSSQIDNESRSSQIDNEFGSDQRNNESGPSLRDNSSITNLDFELTSSVINTLSHFPELESCSNECQWMGGVCIMGNDFRPHCVIVTESCDQIPCRNGKCVSTDDISVCECRSGWAGLLCDEPCSLDCGERGFCARVDTENTVTGCTCRWNYTGPGCEETRKTIPMFLDVALAGGELRTWEVAIVAMMTAVVLALTCVSLPLVLWKQNWLPIRQLFFFFQAYEDNDDKEYDAYISFMSTPRDDRFVRHHLQPRLEKELNFKLCLHFRDFLPGESLLNNITRAIKSSRRTVLVLSPSFVTSEWSKPEYQKAKERLLKCKHRVIPIVLEDIRSVPQMDKNLKRITNSNNSFKWPGEEKSSSSGEIARFWKLLELAMPKKRSHYKRCHSYSSDLPLAVSRSSFNSVVSSLTEKDIISSSTSRSGISSSNSYNNSDKSDPLQRSHRSSIGKLRFPEPWPSHLGQVSTISLTPPSGSMESQSITSGSDDTETEFSTGSSCISSELKVIITKQPVLYPINVAASHAATTPYMDIEEQHDLSEHQRTFLPQRNNVL